MAENSGNWTPEEDKEVFADLPIVIIAKKLRRTVDSVRNRRYILRQQIKPEKPTQTLKNVPETEPRVGIFDVETLPMEAYMWRMFDQLTTIDQIISPTCLLSWAGKFLNEPTLYSDVLNPEEAPIKNDSRIVQSCWEFLNQCQVVIGHNIQQFDTKHMNTFFLKHGLLPLKYIQIDTCLIARQNFNFDSNKMGFINRSLGIKTKIENEGFPLWRKCHHGDKAALKRMQEYNVNDVFASEDLFYKVRPFVKNFNVALYNEMTTNQCPHCGSTKLTSNGWWTTPAGKWESMRCTNCGGLSRTKYNELDKEKKKELLVNIP